MNLHPDLSIIIPAYNEEFRLQKSLLRIRDYLARCSFSSEVIVVNDGSTDGTVRITESVREHFPSLRLISNDVNRGKGYSVRRGMLEARGSFALFTDADLSAPIEEAEKLLAACENGYDGAIGSRAIDRKMIEAHESPFRELAGIVFNGFVRVIAGVTFADTQCGFKLFRMERARPIFEQQRTQGFGFDPEILFLASRHGLRIAEIPVRWAHDPATKVHMVSDSARMLGELLTIRWNVWMGRYPRAKQTLARAGQLL